MTPAGGEGSFAYACVSGARLSDAGRCPTTSRCKECEGAAVLFKRPPAHRSGSQSVVLHKLCSIFRVARVKAQTWIVCCHTRRWTHCKSSHLSSWNWKIFCILLGQTRQNRQFEDCETEIYIFHYFLLIVKIICRLTNENNHCCPQSFYSATSMRPIVHF